MSLKKKDNTNVNNKMSNNNNKGLPLFSLKYSLMRVAICVRVNKEVQKSVLPSFMLKQGPLACTKFLLLTKPPKIKVETQLI